MSPAGAKGFPTTSWSLIRRATNLEAQGSRAALAFLCKAYWEPLYAFLRRRGCSKEDAEDLVQGFFAQLLEANRLDQLTPERGTFRGFMLVALKNFVSTIHAEGRAHGCGDNKIESPEVCDRGLLGGHTCQTEGYSNGVLACTTDCRTFDTSGCF